MRLNKNDSSPIFFNEMKWKLATEKFEFISFDNLLTCLYTIDALGNKEEVWLIGFKS